eukprot:1355200-Amorphochlora_amoeboformis.AAC.1
MLELWHSRLEAVALAQVAISLLGNIGVVRIFRIGLVEMWGGVALRRDVGYGSEPSGTNVAIGMFTYLNCRKEDDQDMMVTAGIHAGSGYSAVIHILPRSCGFIFRGG